MNLKRFFSFLSTRQAKALPIRIDGSLSGRAFHDQEILDRLRETVRALSSRRPYRYDLAFEGGRFSLVIVDPVLPLEAMAPSPESVLSEDLQNVLDALPPEERCKVQCTFRALWNEGGEVKGLAFRVEPPGRVTAELRARPEEAYDRLAEEQAAEGIPRPRRWRVSPAATWLLCIVLVVLGGLYYYVIYRPWLYNSLTEAVEEAELRGLERLLAIEECKMEVFSLLITITPKEDYEGRMKKILHPDQGSNGDPSTGREMQLERLAADAILKGSLELKLFDGDGVLVDQIHLDLTEFDGTAPVTVRTRDLQIMWDEVTRAVIGP